MNFDAKNKLSVVKNILFKNRAKNNIILTISVLCVGLYLYRVVCMVPLVSDEDFINHFYEHKAEIEELVLRYRKFSPPKVGYHHLWKEQGNTKSLMENSEIEYFDYRNESPWLPDPYGKEAGLAIKKSIENKTFFDLANAHPVLRISFKKRDHRGLSFRYFGHIWKDLKYYPNPPLIDGGYLKGAMDFNGNNMPDIRVLDSLNVYPGEWRRGSCVLKKIEPQWFVRMCRA